MIFFINAIGFTVAAFFWNRDSGFNLLCGMFMASMAVTNATLAYPFVSRFIAP